MDLNGRVRRNIGPLVQKVRALARQIPKLWGGRQQRLADSLKMLNENWKVGLLILVPLFFRTIRAFLERVEKAFGMEAPRKPVATSEGTNPPEPPHGEDRAGEDRAALES
jgi:hypothetical protein